MAPWETSKSSFPLHTSAIAPFEKLLDLSEQLARERHDPVGEERAVSLAHTKLGDALTRMGRNREAVDHLRVAVEIDKRMAAADANDLSASRKLFITYLILGHVYRSRTGQQFAGPGEASATLEAAAALADKMAAADPNNKTALMDVLTAWSSLGDLLREQNQLDRAVACYRKTVDAAERLNSDGAHAFANLDAGIQAHHRLGIGLVRMGQASRGARAVPKGRGLSGGLGKTQPGPHPQHSSAKPKLIRGGGKHSRARGAGKRRSALTQAHLRFTKASTKGPQGRNPSERAAGIVRRLGGLLRGDRECERAAEADRAALERYREIEAARPLVEEEQKQRSATIEKLAMLFK